jgi:hypothetical protein
VVSYDYGCGAHSSIVVESIDHPATEHAFDTTGYDDLGPATELDDDAAATADAVQTEVEAAAEPPTDDEVERNRRPSRTRPEPQSSCAERWPAWMAAHRRRQ